MKASGFRKQGYVQIDKEGFLGRVLLWTPFLDDAISPKWIEAKKEPELDHDKVIVTGFINGWCPAYNMLFERAKRACLELGGRVVFHEINTFNKEVCDDWGISDSIFIDRKKVSTGPLLSYKKIKKKISKQLKKCIRGS